MKRFVLLGMVLSAAACGGDDDDDTADATPADAAADAPADAAVATHSGTITVFDVDVYVGSTKALSGAQIGISYVDESAVLQPTMQESTGSTGCKVWEWTLPADADELAATEGTDQGAVTITNASTPTFPPCSFVSAALGYLCIDTGSSGEDGMFTPGPSGASVFTAPSGSSFQAEDVGRYIQFTGATGDNAWLNGTFLIAQLGGVAPAQSIVIGTPGHSVDVAGYALDGTFTTLAGANPAPVTPVDYSGGITLDNDEAFTVSKPASDDFAALTNRALPATGDEFTLGTAVASGTGESGQAKRLLNDIPIDGSVFSVGCDSAAACGTASGSLLVLTTTDTSVASDTTGFGFPAATTKRVQVRCAQFSQHVITVPMAYSQKLIPSNTNTATRIQAQFIRAGLDVITQTGVPNSTSVLVGHAQVGYTTP